MGSGDGVNELNQKAQVSGTQQTVGKAKTSCPEPKKTITILEYPDQFAPATEKAKIRFSVESCSNSKILFKVTSETYPDNTLRTIELYSSGVADGTKTYEWDGLADSGPLSGKHITPFYSPYRLCVCTDDDTASDAQETEIKFHSLELVVDDNDYIVALPGTDEIAEIKVDGNVFTDDSSTDYSPDNSQMYDDTGFEKYRDHVGDGPQIPIFVKVKLINSGNSAVDGQIDLSDYRFMWDWKGKTVTEKIEDLALEYVEAAVDYEVDKECAEQPKGSTNCHVRHGGKRGNPTGDPVFKEHEDFNAAYGTKRKWALVSEYAKNDIGQSAIIFTPGRIAGDAFTVGVVMFHKDDLSSWDLYTLTPDELVEQAKEQLTPCNVTGTFLVKRLIHLAAYLRKKQGSKKLHNGKLMRHYKPVQIEIKPSDNYVRDEFLENMRSPNDFDSVIKECFDEIVSEHEQSVSSSSQVELDDVENGTETDILTHEILAALVNKSNSQLNGGGSSTTGYALYYRTREEISDILITKHSSALLTPFAEKTFNSFTPIDPGKDPLLADIKEDHEQRAVKEGDFFIVKTDSSNDYVKDSDDWYEDLDGKKIPKDVAFEVKRVYTNKRTEAMTVSDSKTFFINQNDDFYVSESDMGGYYYYGYEESSSAKLDFANKIYVKTSDVVDLITVKAKYDLYSIDDSQSNVNFYTGDSLIFVTPHSTDPDWFYDASNAYIHRDDITVVKQLLIKEDYNTIKESYTKGETLKIRNDYSGRIYTLENGKQIHDDKLEKIRPEGGPMFLVKNTGQIQSWNFDVTKNDILSYDENDDEFTKVETYNSSTWEQDCKPGLKELVVKYVGLFYKTFTAMFTTNILMRYAMKLRKDRDPGLIIIQFDGGSNAKSDTVTGLGLPYGPTNGVTMHLKNTYSGGVAGLRYPALADAEDDFNPESVASSFPSGTRFRAFNNGDQFYLADEGRYDMGQLDIVGTINEDPTGYAKDQAGRLVPLDKLDADFVDNAVKGTMKFEDVAAHEIGHNLFLPHAPFPLHKIPAQSKAEAHDSNNAYCLMTYNDIEDLSFCGKCILRLRGWSGENLDPEGEKNRKTV